MHARRFGALSVTLSAVAAAFAVFCVGVAPHEGAALSPVTPTSSPYVSVYPGVADAVDLAVSLSVPGLSIPGVEPRCFDTAIPADADAVRAAAESAADGASTVWWLPPTRAVWEAGGRLITCLVGPFADGDWSAPPGLVPTPKASKA